jgi:hypothetical protein
MTFAFQRLGKRWTDIAAQLEGRTENQVKNYMFSRQRAQKRRTGAVGLVFGGGDDDAATASSMAGSEGGSGDDDEDMPLVD